jgi:hypothetical protein
MQRMMRFSAVALICAATHASAQSSARIRQLEIAVDIGGQASAGSESTRRWDAPLSIRYGAVNSQYRFTIDQRFTMGDHRIVAGRAPLSLDTELGWRLGSRDRISRTVLGPYLFSGFNLTGPHSYFGDDDARHGYYGVSAGIGARVALFQLSLRPELVVGHDFGRGARTDPTRVSARNRIGVRLGYGYTFRLHEP